MKRVKRAFLFLTAIGVIFLASCTSDANVNQVNDQIDLSMTGYIVKKDEKRVLLVNNLPKVTGGNKEYFDAVWVSGISEKVGLGQKADVWFDEALAESYPMQGKSKRVTIIPGLIHAGAALTEEEVIRKALADKETENIQLFVVKSIKYDDKLDNWAVQYKNGLFVSEKNTEVKELQIPDK